MFYKFARGLVRALVYIFMGKPKVIGREKLDNITEGSLILCANHMSNWDPIVLGLIYKRQVFFMAKEALFKNPLLRKIMYAGGAFPVAKDGKDINAVKQALKVLKSGGTLGIFPEGRRYYDGKVHELKDGVTLLAHKTKTTVVPVGIKKPIKFFRRPVLEVGDPIDYSRFYEQKATPEVYKEMNNVLYKAIKSLVEEKKELNG